MYGIIFKKDFFVAIRRNYYMHNFVYSLVAKNISNKKFWMEIITIAKHGQFVVIQLICNMRGGSSMMLAVLDYWVSVHVQ